MRTFSINLNHTNNRSEPGGIAGNVFQLGSPFMENIRPNQNRPFPELFWTEENIPEPQINLRQNHWQSYNAAAHNIRSARILTSAAANHLAEAALMLTLVQTMLDEAESSSADIGQQIAERAANVLGNIDSSFAVLERAFERTGSRPSSFDSDTFTVQSGIDANQTRTIEISQINSRTLGLGDGRGNINIPDFLDEMRQNVSNAISIVRNERMHVNNAISALDNDRRALDLNQWGNNAVEPGRINPPLADDATAEEQMNRAEAERAMRMMELRREAGNLRTLFEMIELFRS